jgi:hypothetical protein
VDSDLRCEEHPPARARVNLRARATRSCLDRAPTRRVPRSAYSLVLPPGLPTRPVGNPAHDGGRTPVPPGSPFTVDRNKLAAGGRGPSNSRGAGLRRRIARRVGRCRIAEQTLGMRGHPRRECRHRWDRIGWPSVCRGHQVPYRLSPKKRTRLRRANSSGCASEPSRIILRATTRLRLICRAL